MGGQGKVALLSGSPTAPEHVGRVQAFKKALAEYGKIEIVFEEPDEQRPDHPMGSRHRCVDGNRRDTELGSNREDSSKS